MKFAWKYRRVLWKYRNAIRHRRAIGAATLAAACGVGAMMLVRSRASAAKQQPA
ncbi:MAG TPA: hypothetical protein VN736_07215 [Candidatus Limnocylindrales bacterium]|nr:hypothetical protein [Candidatus Limnocylindrales bacterium]